MGELEEGEEGEELGDLPELEPLRELELDSGTRNGKWLELLQVPPGINTWRKNFKSPEKSEITRVQCDPVQAHQDILGVEDYEEWFSILKLNSMFQIILDSDCGIKP